MSPDPRQPRHFGPDGSQPFDDYSIGLATVRVVRLQDGGARAIWLQAGQPRESVRLSRSEARRFVSALASLCALHDVMSKTP